MKIKRIVLIALLLVVGSLTAAVAGLALLAVGAIAAAASHDDDQRDRHGDRHYNYRDRESDLRGYESRRSRGLAITCESRDRAYRYCKAPIHGSRVRLVRRYSDTGCEFHRDWGYNKGGIWVENGCRARFEIE